MANHNNDNPWIILALYIRKVERLLDQLPPPAQPETDLVRLDVARCTGFLSHLLDDLHARGVARPASDTKKG